MRTDGDQDPPLGIVLEGRYQLVDMLGHGGMGSVYVARDIRLGRRYALKVLSPELARDRSFVERFLREAQMIAQLQHPNIVDIHSFGEDPSGIVFFTMELLTGEDLDSRIYARSMRPYTVHDACAWAIGIARAVAAVHENGLIHRDLKAQNVFLARSRDGSEVVKLLDFGIARPEHGSELTETGMTLGTPSYMSPEQLNAEPLDRRTDIYSFGVVLFKLVTGRLPFRGDPVQVGTQHVTAPVPVPSLVAPGSGITPELDALILKAMAKQRSARQATMAEVERALLEASRQLEGRLPAGPAPHRSSPSLTKGMAPSGPLPAPARLSVAPSHPDDASATDAPTQVARAASLRRSAVSHEEGAPDRRARAPRPARDQGAAEATGPALANSSTTAPSIIARRRPTASPPTAGRSWSRLLAIQVIVGSLIVLALWLRFGRDPETPATAEAPAEPTPPLTPLEAPAIPESPSSSPALPPPSPPEEKVVTPPPSPDEPIEALTKLEETRPNAPPTTKKKSPTPKTTAPPEPEPPPPPPVADPFANTEEPFTTIYKKAAKCRVIHKATDSPKVTIVFSVGEDGTVISAHPLRQTDLGRCLADAVRAVRFEPRRRLGQTISL